MFVTNLTLNSVTAINTATSHTTTVHGAPPAMNGPLGIAIAPDGDTAYVTNSNANTVTPIDLKSSTFSLEAPIHVGSGPAAIAITPERCDRLREQLQLQHRDADRTRASRHTPDVRSGSVTDRGASR